MGLWENFPPLDSINSFYLNNSYLSGRTKSVKTNSAISNQKNVTSGVPQGSVLGPIFFILFLDDITESLQISDYFLYCDDLKILSSKETFLIQTEIDCLNLWAFENGEQFHPDECKRLNFNWHEPLTINGALIIPVNEMVDLGVVISSDLKRSSPVGAKLATCNKVYNFLCRNVPFNTSIKKHLSILDLTYITVLFPSMASLHNWFEKHGTFSEKSPKVECFRRWVHRSALSFKHLAAVLSTG